MSSREEQIKEVIRCAKDPVHFMNRYVKIQHPLKGTVPFETYPFQNDCVHAFNEHRLNIILKSRQLGLSTVSAAYCVWMALFQQNKNILVIATKLPTANNFVKKVKFMLDSLPRWLAISPYEPNSTEVKFKNGSSIKAIPTGEDAGRSEALSLLVVDECVAGNTLVTVKSPLGEEMTVSIDQFYAMLNAQQNQNTSYVYLEDDDDMDTGDCA